MIARAVTLARAAAGHVAEGLPIADDATIAARRATCDACPSLTGGGCLCGACGCILAIKLRWADQACPLDRFPAVPPKP